MTKVVSHTLFSFNLAFFSEVTPGLYSP